MKLTATTGRLRISPPQEHTRSLVSSGAARGKPGRAETYSGGCRRLQQE
jgi:hypothetical protein